jgi:hypothetical protein
MALFIRLRWPEHIVTFAPLCIVSVVRCESNASFLQLTSAGRTLEIEKPNYSRLKNLGRAAIFRVIKTALSTVGTIFQRNFQPGY